MVYRVFVEKKKELAHEANNLKEDIRSLLRIDALEDLRIVNRYDVENIEPAFFRTAFLIENCCNIYVTLTNYLRIYRIKYRCEYLQNILLKIFLRISK